MSELIAAFEAWVYVVEIVLVFALIALVTIRSFRAK